MIKDELAEIRKKYADARRTQIKADEGELDVEDLIAEEDVIITVSRAGYVKRQPVDAFKRQGRGGKGVKGANLKEEDVIKHVFTTTTHHWLLFFTIEGQGLPGEGARGARGRAARRAASTPRTCRACRLERRRADHAPCIDLKEYEDGQVPVVRDQERAS